MDKTCRLFSLSDINAVSFISCSACLFSDKNGISPVKIPVKFSMSPKIHCHNGRRHTFTWLSKRRWWFSHPISGVKALKGSINQSSTFCFSLLVWDSCCSNLAASSARCFFSRSTPDNCCSSLVISSIAFFTFVSSSSTCHVQHTCLQVRNTGKYQRDCRCCYYNYYRVEQNNGTIGLCESQSSHIFYKVVWKHD